MVQRFCFLLFYLLIAFSVSSQTLYPTDYFRSPVGFPILLAGNFGEIRPNHLHAGFDIKTGGKEGKDIYAIADGYVSRISIKTGGYGKALYINHPNGFTSVYAHLKSFSEPIAKATKNMQYSMESFVMDTLLPANLIQVKKGELIALSGNTGSSMGPHLHFEIRDTQSEDPINPYYFGYRVSDNVKPRITKVAIYPVGKNASVNGAFQPKIITAHLNSVGYYFASADSITVNGDIGFGIDCYDTETASPNHNGVFSIELQTFGERVFYSELEKFSFANSRYVNAYIDYAEKQKNRSKIQKCYLLKNNHLEIYKDTLNDGLIHFNDDANHWVKFIVKDFGGNTTELVLKVKSTSKEIVNPHKDTVGELFFNCLKPNVYKDDDLEISIPESCLYEDIHFKVKKTAPVKWTFSKLYHIQDNRVGAHKPYSLSIKADGIPEGKEDKAIIVSIDGNLKKYYVGGEYKDGWVSTTTKNFGNYAITTDTRAPNLRPNFKIVDKNNVNFRGAGSIGIIVSDNLSGVQTYRATIDGKWVLCEYETKKKLLFYEFDENILPGKHEFRIEVGDAKNNVAVWECGFWR